MVRYIIRAVGASSSWICGPGWLLRNSRKAFTSGRTNGMAGSSGWLLATDHRREGASDKQRKCEGLAGGARDEEQREGEPEPMIAERRGERQQRRIGEEGGGHRHQHGA